MDNKMKWKNGKIDRIDKIMLKIDKTEENSKQRAEYEKYYLAQGNKYTRLFVLPRISLKIEFTN